MIISSPALLHHAIRPEPKKPRMEHGFNTEKINGFFTFSVFIPCSIRGWNYDAAREGRRADARLGTSAKLESIKI